MAKQSEALELAKFTINKILLYVTIAGVVIVLGLVIIFKFNNFHVNGEETTIKKIEVNTK